MAAGAEPPAPRPARRASAGPPSSGELSADRSMRMRRAAKGLAGTAPPSCPLVRTLSLGSGLPGVGVLLPVWGSAATAMPQLGAEERPGWEVVRVSAVFKSLSPSSLAACERGLRSRRRRNSTQLAAAPPAASTVAPTAMPAMAPAERPPPPAAAGGCSLTYRTEVGLMTCAQRRRRARHATSAVSRVRWQACGTLPTSARLTADSALRAPRCPDSRTHKEAFVGAAGPAQQADGLGRGGRARRLVDERAAAWVGHAALPQLGRAPRVYALIRAVGVRPALGGRKAVGRR